MDSSINQNNYVEWLKLVQKSYFVAYICSFIILSHILTIDVTKAENLQSLPLFGVSLPRTPAVLLTILIFWGSGALVAVAYVKIRNIGDELPPNVLSALNNFPSIGNSSWRADLVIVSGLFLIFLIIFLNGAKPLPFLDSILFGLLMTGPYFLAILQKVIKNQPEEFIKRRINKLLSLGRKTNV